MKSPTSSSSIFGPLPDRAYAGPVKICARWLLPPPNGFSRLLNCAASRCCDHQVLLSVVPLHARTLRSENIRAKEEAKLAVNSSL
jgi:hypothetical protein